jgi:hypothetical protein
MTGWIPFRVRVADVPMVDWCYLGRERFVEPFFGDTVNRCLRQPFNQLFLRTTSIDALLERQRTHPGASPTAFIFHGSRCGSTLTAQLAAALPQVIAISEAPPIDSVLGAAGLDDGHRIAWLRALVSALAQPRAGGERHLIVKFDAWHALHIDVVRRAFAETPAIFLYRDPGGVLASQLRMPGVHTVPGRIDPAVLGLDLPAALTLDREEYAGRVLGRIYAAGADAVESGGVTPVNYAELPGRAISLVLEWCRLTEHDAGNRLREVAQFDAKTPSLPFDASRARHPPLGARAEHMAATFIQPHYARLEAVRSHKAGKVCYS